MGKYSGTGDKADLINHTNQINPDHPEHEHSHESGALGHDSDDDD